MDVKKKGFESETSAFNVKSHISREPGRENRGHYCFLELVSNQLRIFLGSCRWTSAVSRWDRCQGRPSLKSRLQAAREYLLRLRASPRTQTGARGGEIIMHGLFTLQAQLCFDFGVLALTIYLPGRSRRRPQINSKTTLNEEQQLLFWFYTTLQCGEVNYNTFW